MCNSNHLSSKNFQEMCIAIHQAKASAKKRIVPASKLDASLKPKAKRDVSEFRHQPAKRPREEVTIFATKVLSKVVGMI